MEILYVIEICYSRHCADHFQHGTLLTHLNCALLRSSKALLNSLKASLLSELRFAEETALLRRLYVVVAGLSLLFTRKKVEA